VKQVKLCRFIQSYHARAVYLSHG